MPSVRVFDLSPANGTLAVGNFYTKVVPVRGALSIAWAFINTGGGSGVATPAHRFGEEALPLAADKMDEGGTGHYSGSEQPMSGTLANVWKYGVLYPLNSGPIFPHAYWRMRINTATAPITGVTLRAIVTYADRMEPEGHDPRAVLEQPALQDQSN